jgi:Family of unknown function (DUF5719)
MSGRLRFASTALLSIAVAGGALYLDHEVGPRVETARSPLSAVSGAWFCPHGGGSTGWRVAITIANPGESVVHFRLRTLETPAGVELEDLPPRSEVTLSLPPERRAGSTIVEYFGGWVAAGWTATGGGEERGTAAEPCLPRAGRTWLLPDGTTEQGQDAFVVVMNPFAADAVFTVQMVTEDRRIRTRDWTDFVLPGGRSTVFDLNTKALGERTVAAEVLVSIGRVVASSLGITEGGGIRSAVGLLGGGARELQFPGDADEGNTALVVMNPGQDGAAFSVSVRPGEPPLGQDAPPDEPVQPPGETPSPGIPEEVLAPGVAATFDLTSPDPAVLELRVAGDSPLAAVRRSANPLGDQASTPGAAAPWSAWVLVPARPAPGEGLPSALLLANPGAEGIEVSLTPLSVVGGETGPSFQVHIAAGSMVSIPQADPDDPVSFLAVSPGGEFVALSRSLSQTDGGYALSLGIPVPTAWIPA